MKRIHWPQTAFAVAAIAWAGALPGAAWGLHQNPVGGLFRAAVTLVYAAGAVVCHQRPERSFHLEGVPLPVCARCTGIYVAAAATALVLVLLARRRIRERAGDHVRASGATLRGVSGVRWAAVAAVAPTLLTLAWEWTLLSTPSNLVRAAAGAPIGTLVSWVMLGGNRGVPHEDSRPSQSE